MLITTSLSPSLICDITLLSYNHLNVFFSDLVQDYSATMTCQLWGFTLYFALLSPDPGYFPKNLLVIQFVSWQKEEGIYSLQSRSTEFSMTMEKHNNRERHKRGEKEWIKVTWGSDVKWLKQFLFKCKFDFKDGTTSNCTLNGKMKTNLKYGMNKVYVDFLGIIFYYENLDIFLSQSILWLTAMSEMKCKHFLICLSPNTVSSLVFLVHSSQMSQNNDQ